MASEKLTHEKYWAYMVRATRVVDSWPEWEKGSSNVVHRVDASSQATNAIATQTDPAQATPTLKQATTFV